MPLRFVHPEGASLALSQHLSGFLARRAQPTEKFLLGHWISTLDDIGLAQLHALTIAFRDGDASSAMDDLLAISLIATSAETGYQQQRVSEVLLEGWVASLYAAALIEGYRRKGWLEIEEPSSIVPGRHGAVRITEAGASQEDVRQRFGN
ncbi:hypothetical protein [Aquabacterium parvum]|uniref:hypothetical protein n=1 Tax=Aquabacterium parvum TaxID=70584 RepID=UPI000719030B|nr:hypothetical protein [Aquabacterium parvum]